VAINALRKLITFSKNNNKIPSEDDANSWIMKELESGP
jgi:hypothetical protein